MKSLSKKLSFQILVIFLVIGLFIPLAIYIGAGFSISGALTSMEETQLKEISSKILQTWDMHGKLMEHNVEDYAYWDETYRNMQRPQNTPWFKEQISGWVSQSYNFNLVILADTAGKVIDYHGPAGVDNNISRWPEFSKSWAGSLHGFKEIAGELYSYATCPVRNNLGQGEPRGIMIFGYKINPSYLNTIAAPFSQNIAILNGDNFVVQEQQKHFPEDSRKQTMALGKGTLSSETVIKGVGGEYIYSFVPLTDISGNKIATMVVGDSRAAFNATGERLSKLAGIFLIGSIPVILILGWFLYKNIVFPLQALQATIDRVIETKKAFITTAKGSEEFNRLAGAFNEMAVTLEEQRELREENAALALLANTDGLTGLFNRRYFYEKLRETVNEAEKLGKQFSVLFLDVDRLKYINDVYGHLKGDEVIQMIGRIVGNMAGVRDTAARYGGDEFAIILPDAGPAEAARVARLLEEQVRTASSSLGIFLPNKTLTLSAGISTYPDSARTPEELINAADIELFNTKSFSQQKIGAYWPLLTKVDWMDREDLYNFARMALVFIDCMDKYTYYHTERVIQAADVLARHLGMDKADRETVKIAALFHDIGKLEVGAKILNKKEQLTEAEWAIIKMHPVWGSHIVGAVEDLQEIVPVVRHHHEHYDGKGYPDGLQGEAIPLGARILAVVDSFDALTTHRVYHPARTLAEAIAEIKKSAGTQLDPGIVEKFLEVAEDIFVGRLS